MDLSYLVTAAVGLLAPYLRDGAAALAKNLKDDLKEAVPKAAESIYETVKSLFSKSKKNEEVLEEAGAGDEDSMKKLSDLLEQAMAFNQAFKDQIEQTLKKLETDAKVPLQEILDKVASVSTTTIKKTNTATNVNLKNSIFIQGDGNSSTTNK